MSPVTESEALVLPFTAIEIIFPILSDRNRGCWTLLRTSGRGARLHRAFLPLPVRRNCERASTLITSVISAKRKIQFVHHRGEEEQPKTIASCQSTAPPQAPVQVNI